MAKLSDIVVPDLGDFSDVEIIEVLVQPGDSVQREDGLITLETDKATMDVPAAESGVIESLAVAVGDTVSSGDTIGQLRPADDDAGDGAADGDAGDQTADGDAGDGAADGDAGDQAADAPADAGEDTMVTSPAEEGAQILAVQDLGDFENVDVIEVHIEAGDSVDIDDPLITLETDKATMDIPSTAAGTIDKVLVKVGDKVSTGDDIAVIEAIAAAVPKPAEKKTAADETGDKAPAASAAPAPAPKAEPTRQRAGRLPAIDEAGFSRAHASPSVRKLARELGVDLVQVKGTGPKNRILHDDVKAFVKSILTGAAPAAGPSLPQVPSVDFAKFGDIETVALTRIQKISGPRLQASWINLPHVTQHDLADITDLEARRQELKGPAKDKGVSLTPLAFIMKACIATLKAFPKANASLSGDGESLVYKKYFHLGFAADTENGLMVPVIRDADRMDVYELAAALGTLSKAAREGKLTAQQMQGASFTISSLGGIGGTAFTPIVNAPEVAILGVSRSSMQPVWSGSRFDARLMLPLSLSYDHRVIDGAYAVRFTTHLCETLADVDALLEGAEL